MPTVSYMDEEPVNGPGPRGPHLAIAFSCIDPLAHADWVPTTCELSDVYQVDIGRGDSGFAIARNPGDNGARLSLELPDTRMSGRHARLVRELDRWHLSDLGSKNGTFVAGERVTQTALDDGAVIELGTTVLLFRSGSEVPAAELPSAGAADPDAPELATLEPALAATFATVRRLAPSDLSLLLQGQTGTGTEVVARAIHRLSGRSGAFVAVNCSAFPETLIASELFGVERGAYSGAHKSRRGLIRSAHQGTLFLDEIAELPLPSQAVLLRVLQDGLVTPVGGSNAERVDVRVLAASHQDLEDRVHAGAFRRDLLARLRGFTVTLPALRKRREDIGLLVARLLPKVAGERAPRVRFSRRAGGQLFLYHWPDNVRELEKTLHAAVLLAGDQRIQLEHLPTAVARARPHQPPHAPDSQNPVPDPIGRIHLKDPDAADKLRALARQCDGNVSAMARALQTSRAQVKRLLDRLGIADDLPS